MELKRFYEVMDYPFVSLLIVPYGIETQFIAGCKQGIALLIVPYGIETQDVIKHFSFPALLIVPYGIETCLIA